MGLGDDALNNFLYHIIFKNQTLINTDRFNAVLPAETTTWFNLAIPAETTTWFM